MTRYVALLRGVNVSGKNKLPMASLREALVKTSFYGVTTYIQSGNIIFNSDLELANCEVIISELLKSEFDLNVPVIVKKQSDIEEIVKENPFKSKTLENSKFMSFGYFNKVPDAQKVEEIKSFSIGLETFKIENDVIYFYCGIGFGKTKLTNAFFEKKLGVVSTMRNCNTTLKLTEL